MKRILQMAAFAVLILLGSTFPQNASAQYDDYDDGYYDDGYYDDRGDVDYQTFYDELSPHGNWVEYPGYGYVWQPSIGNDFRPYSTGGHWVWSDRYEWVWVSDYDWGWAPFHYGRWFQDARYGWLWVPGYEWSGAWVTWRDGGDYYGWAPIRPGFNISININLGGYNAPYDWWTFTPRRYILYPNWYNHRVDYHRNVTIINQTTIINNYYYGDSYGFRTGPRRSSFEVYTGRVTHVQFRQSNRPGRTTFRNNELSIYRPSVRQQEQNDTRIAPRRFQRNDGSIVNNTDVRVRGNRNEDFRNPNRERTDQLANPNGLPRERANNRRFERTGDRTQTQDGTIRTNPRNTEPREPRIRNNQSGNNNGNSEPRFERRREPNVNNAPVRQPRTEQPRTQEPRTRQPRVQQPRTQQQQT